MRTVPPPPGSRSRVRPSSARPGRFCRFRSGSAGLALVFLAPGSPVSRPGPWLAFRLLFLEPPVPYPLAPRLRCPGLGVSRLRLLKLYLRSRPLTSAHQTWPPSFVRPASCRPASVSQPRCPGFGVRVRSRAHQTPFCARGHQKNIAVSENAPGAHGIVPRHCSTRAAGMNTAPPAICAGFIAPQEATKSIEMDSGKTLAGIGRSLVIISAQF